jgi:hypothetical protein
MATVRERMLDHVQGLLEGSAPAGTTVHRQRTRPIAQDQLGAWVVWGSGSRFERQDHGTRLWIVSWVVEVRRAVIPPQVPDTALDEDLELIYSTVLADSRLGGLALTTDPVKEESDAQEGERLIGMLAIQFESRLPVAPGDLSESRA